MNKVVYIGPTCYLGQWHFTRGKQYDIHQHERSVYYVISDNDYKYYINKQNKANKPFCDLQHNCNSLKRLTAIAYTLC